MQRHQIAAIWVSIHFVGPEIATDSTTNCRFAVANLAVHFVMVLRMYGLYNQSGAVLISLSALAILDFAAEIVASTYVQR